MRLLARRDPAAGDGEARPAGADDEPRAEGWTGGPQLITRLATAGLWLMLATGPVALALVAAVSLTAPEPRPVAQATEAPDNGARTTVGEFAQRLVVDWLQTPQGQERRLEAYGLLGSETQQPETAQHASFPAVAIATEVAPGLWSVTVGVTVAEPATTEPTPEDSAEGTADRAPEARIDSADSAEATPTHRRQYFQVSVEYRDGMLAAQALPAAVPAPPTAGHSGLIYDETVAPSDPLGEAMAGFLSALLSGDGEVGSYTAPDSDIAAVTPPPYLQISVVGVRADDAPDPDAQPTDGARVHVLVTAVALTRAHQEVTLQYPLTLNARPGRWEVVEISPAARRVSTDS